jgi:hypothetical protein
MDRIEFNSLKKVLMRYGMDIVNLMKTELSNNGKRNTGNLIDSLRPYTEEDDDKEYLYVEMPKYGEYVDSGRRPNSNFPPREPIRTWIRQKGIRPNEGMTEQQLVYLIQRKIGIRGVEAVPFINIFYDNVDNLNDMIEDSTKEDLENNINEFIKNNFKK